MRSSGAVVLLAALALASTGGGAQAAPLAVACSPDRPTARAEETVTVRAWASPGTTVVSFAWSSPTGRLEAQGAEARWLLGAAAPGSHAATVRVTDSAGSQADCLVRVLVRGAQRRTRGALPPPARAPAPAPPAGTTLPRETGSAWLVRGEGEADGYGLYSYLLLGSPPTDAHRARVLEVLSTFTRLIPDIQALEPYVARRELNIAYVPLTERPDAGVTAAWLLDHYDYARARSVLRLVGRGHDGPYFVSTLRPIGRAGGGAGTVRPVLVQDMSGVPVHLVGAWVKEFLNQAAQERFWEERTGRQLVVSLRLTVAVLAQGLPEVRQALDDWITWLR
jgi:hypothetical protein